jgi:hypothetical protein
VITDFLIHTVGGFVTWLLNHFPAPGVPSWYSGAPAQVAWVMGQVGLFSTWLPVVLITAVIVSYFAVLAVALLVKVARIGASFATFGGGSAA